MNRASFALLASLVVASVFARSEAPEVTFVSPCDCQDFHGKNRWVAKTDLTPFHRINPRFNLSRPRKFTHGKG